MSDLRSDLCKKCIHTKVCMKDKNVCGDVFVPGNPMIFDNNKLWKEYEERKAKGFPCVDFVDANIVPKWIPVTERLPENNTRVIGFMAWKSMTAIERQHNKWYSIDHLEPLPDEAVTHWMPLPEPPKEDEA